MLDGEITRAKAGISEDVIVGFLTLSIRKDYGIVSVQGKQVSDLT